MGLTAVANYGLKLTWPDSEHDGCNAKSFVEDLAGRFANRVQIHRLARKPGLEPESHSRPRIRGRFGCEGNAAREPWVWRRPNRLPDQPQGKWSTAARLYV